MVSRLLAPLLLLFVVGQLRAAGRPVMGAEEKPSSGGDARPALRLLFHPVFDAGRQAAMFAPLAERLGAKLGRSIQVLGIRSFEGLCRSLANGRGDFAIVAAPEARRLVARPLAEARIVAAAVVDGRHRYRAVLVRARGLEAKDAHGVIAWASRRSRSLRALDVELRRELGSAWTRRPRRYMAGHGDALDELLRGRVPWAAVSERALGQVSGHGRVPLELVHRGPWLPFDAFLVNRRISPERGQALLVALLADQGFVPETRELLEWRRCSNETYDVH